MATKKKKHKKRRRLIIRPRFFLVVALLVLALGVLVLLLVSLFSGGSATESTAPIQSTEGQKKGGIFQFLVKETPDTSMMSHLSGAISHRWMFSGTLAASYTCHSVSRQLPPSYPFTTSSVTP